MRSVVCALVVSADFAEEEEELNRMEVKAAEILNSSKSKLGLTKEKADRFIEQFVPRDYAKAANEAISGKILNIGEVN